jgi:hypothetical protein
MRRAAFSIGGAAEKSRFMGRLFVVVAWLMGSLWMACPVPANAAGGLSPSLGGVLGNPDGPPKPPADSGSAIAQVQGLLDSFTGDIDKLSSGKGAAADQLRMLGQRIAVALFGTILAWGTVRSWVLDRGLGQLLPELVQPLVALGLSLWAVDGFAGPVRDSIVSLGDLIASDIDSRIVNETGLLEGLGGTALQLLITPIADGFHPFGWLAAKLVAILAAAVLMLSSVIGAGMIIVAKLQTAVALLLAPVFIPWAMWQPTMFLFNAWLSFLISGAMTQAMVKIMAAFTTAAVGRMSAIVESYAHHDVSIVAFGALFASSLIITFMFLSAPRLATALVGGVSVGLEGWVHTAAAGARAAAQLTKAAGGAAVQGARAAFKAGRAAADSIRSSRAERGKQGG